MFVYISLFILNRDVKVKYLLKGKEKKNLNRSIKKSQEVSQRLNSPSSTKGWQRKCTDEISRNKLSDQL